MTRVRGVGVLIACAALAYASLALAASTSVTDPKHDLLSTMLPNGVQKDDVDITKATTGTANGKIKMTMTVAGSIGKAIAHKDTPPEFQIKVGKSNYFGIFPTDGKVIDFTAGQQSGSASMTKVNSHKVATTFKPKAVGSPSKYGWFALVGDCIVYDRAPDTGWTNSKSKRC
jgi:hypothetical protein